MEKDEVIDSLNVDLNKIDNVISKETQKFGAKYSDIVMSIIIDGLNSGLMFEQICTAMNHQFNYESMRISIAVQVAKSKEN